MAVAFLLGAAAVLAVVWLVLSERARARRRSGFERDRYAEEIELYRQHYERERIRKEATRHEQDAADRDRIREGRDPACGAGAADEATGADQGGEGG